MESLPWSLALEQYTQRVPQEVLKVEVEQAGSVDVVIIFRGFSSSLVRATPADPSLPVIDQTAKFIRLDRLKAPFNPADPVVIARDLDLEATRVLLQSAGLDPNVYIPYS